MDRVSTPIPIWKVAEPTDQARAPEWMSFHVFKEAQRCPLSVALRRSSYSQLWGGFGYPSRPTAAAVSGIVVHEAAEILLKELAQAGVTSLMHPEAMNVLRRLGGFTKVLENSLVEFFARENDNPRFEQFPRRPDSHFATQATANESNAPGSPGQSRLGSAQF